MTNATYINADQVQLNSRIRFNYPCSTTGELIVRQGTVDRFTKSGFTLELEIDGDTEHGIGSHKYKSFATERIASNILMLPVD